MPLLLLVLGLAILRVTFTAVNTSVLESRLLITRQPYYWITANRASSLPIGSCAPTEHFLQAFAVRPSPSKEGLAEENVSGLGVLCWLVVTSGAVYTSTYSDSIFFFISLCKSDCSLDMCQATAHCSTNIFVILSHTAASMDWPYQHEQFGPWCSARA